MAVRSWASSFDVLIAHGSKSLPVSVLSLLGGVTPIVYVNIGDPRAWAGSRLRRRRTSLLYKGVDAVAAISPTSAAVLTSDFGVPPRKVRVIPNGRDDQYFVPSTAAERAEARSDLGIPCEGPVVGYVGALTEEKRVHLLVEAVAALPDAFLLVAGDGHLRPQLQALIQAQLPGRSRMLGQVSDVRSVYWSSDVLALPSRTEGLPGVLIEAGMCGLPVVATRVGMVEDVVSPGVTGELVARDAGREDFTEALVRSLERRDPYGSAARDHCTARFGLASVTGSWLALIKAMVSSS
jgi:glycosyltransferase involved in cell wall biosynthesis